MIYSSYKKSRFCNWLGGVDWKLLYGDWLKGSDWGWFCDCWGNNGVDCWKDDLPCSGCSTDIGLDW